MITINAVPTSTPVPRAVMSRNCRGVKFKLKGSKPAKKELFSCQPCNLATVDFGACKCASSQTYAAAMAMLKKSNIMSPVHMLGLCLRRMRGTQGKGFRQSKRVQMRAVIAVVT
jgi:hypothetical protein